MLRLLTPRVEVVEVGPELRCDDRPALRAEIDLHETAILVGTDSHAHKGIRLEQQRAAEAVEGAPPAVRLSFKGQQIKLALTIGSAQLYVQLADGQSVADVASARLRTKPPPDEPPTLPTVEKARVEVSVLIVGFGANSRLGDAKLDRARTTLAQTLNKAGITVRFNRSEVPADPGRK